MAPLPISSDNLELLDRVPQVTKIQYYIFYSVDFASPRNSSEILRRGIHTSLIFSNLQYNSFLPIRSVYIPGDKQTKNKKTISLNIAILGLRYWNQQHQYRS